MAKQAVREDEAFRKAQPESPLELFCKKWNVYFENRWFKAKVVAANVLQTPACFPCVWRIVIQLESADIQLEFNVSNYTREMLFGIMN